MKCGKRRLIGHSWAGDSEPHDFLLATARKATYPPATMKLEDIAAEASKLSEEERASLASRLLHGLESPVYEVADAEVFQRMREAENDPTVWLTFDQLVSGLNRHAR